MKATRKYIFCIGLIVHMSLVVSGQSVFPFSPIEQEIFTQERCKKLISFSQTTADYQRPNQKKAIRRFQRTVFFDSLGRPIRSVEADSNQWKNGSYEKTWSYGEDGCIQLAENDSLYRIHCKDGMVDSTFTYLSTFGKPKRLNNATLIEWENGKRKSETTISGAPKHVGDPSRVAYTHYFYDEVAICFAFKVNSRPILIH